MRQVCERCPGGLLHFRAMKRILRLFALALVFLWQGPVHAEVDNLYAAEVPVADDTQAVRNQALRQVMRLVLVRLSGSTQVAGNPAVASMLGRAPALVQQFRYRLEQAVPGVERAPQRYLWARFDKAGLDRLMRSAGVPVWGANRPRVLIWLAAERAGQRQLLSLEDSRAEGEALRTRADARGMPLQLPLMDLLDQSALSAADLWAGYEAAIREASVRYPHEVILTGRLRNLGGRWEAQWTLWDGDNTESFTARGRCRKDAILAGIDTAQDLLAAHYAPVASGDGPGRLRVRFTGVDSLPAYGRLMQIIGEQDGITRVNVRASQAENLYLDLWVRGGENALTRILSLGGELFLVPREQLPVETAVQQMPQDAGQIPQAEQSLPVDLTFSYLPTVSGSR